MPFFQPFDRASATQWVQTNPHRPVLRPCNFTAVHPHILAVTYRGEDNTIRHSLVERVGNAFLHVLYHESAFVRTRIRYESEAEMEQALRSLQKGEEDPSPRKDEDPC